MGIISEEIGKMDKEIIFDVEKFLIEDCKEENEIGIKMTFSILNKAFEKGMQNSALYCYEKGKKDIKTEFITMLTKLQSEIAELKSYESADGQDLVMLADIGTLFQQKINKLKEV
jgi:hypothetical protein